MHVVSCGALDQRPVLLCIRGLYLISVCACRLRKLMYRVVFPFELKLCNTSAGCDAADSVYNLFAVVVHIGSGMNHGEQSLHAKHVQHFHATRHTVNRSVEKPSYLEHVLKLHILRE